MGEKMKFSRSNMPRGREDNNGHPASERFRPKKLFGQHFLFDKNLIARIVRTADIREGDHVLEIGPGPGTLTDGLLDAGAFVVAVEIDTGLYERLKARFAGVPNIELICGDALKLPFASLRDRYGVRFKAVANLPYNISAPILFKFLRDRRAFTALVMMLQKEVAERIAAPPGNRDYGILSVLCQAHFEVRVEFNVSRQLFRPTPKVDSSVVSFIVRERPGVDMPDEGAFERVVKAAFAHRRKTLSNTLVSLPAGKGEVLKALEGCGIDPKRRGETLSLQEFSNLTKAFLSIRSAGLPEP